MTRLDFVASILRTPYDIQTTNCWWLARLVERELFGRDLPEVVAADVADPRRRARVLAEHEARQRWRQVPRPVDGALVLMGRTARLDTHVGVYLDEPRGVIHTDDPHGVVVDSALELTQSRRWRLSFWIPVE